MDWLVVCMFVGSFVCVLGSKYDNMASRNPATSDESQPCHNWRVATLPQVASRNPATIGESQPCMLWLFLSCMCCNLPLCSSCLLAAAARSLQQPLRRWVIRLRRHPLWWAPFWKGRRGRPARRAEADRATRPGRWRWPRHKHTLFIHGNLIIHKSRSR